MKINTEDKMRIEFQAIVENKNNDIKELKQTILRL